MSQGLAWILILVAGLLDVAWAGTMKLNQGFTRCGWSAASIALLTALVIALGQGVRVLPVGTAYAVWTGVGAVGTVLLGIAAFNEPVTFGRLICLTSIIAGVIGLKLIAE